MKHRSRYADDRDIQPLLPTYIARLGETLKQIEQHRAANNAEEIRRIVHQLKGSGKSYGFDEISTLSAIIDQQLTTTRSLAEASSPLDDLLHYIRHIEGYRD